MREDFAADALARAGISFTYLKSVRGAKTPNFLIEQEGESFIIEVGGPGKSMTQFKNSPATFRKILFCDQVAVGENKLPLFMLGYLE